jgi:hypothetical protein
MVRVVLRVVSGHCSFCAFAPRVVLLLLRVCLFFEQAIPACCVCSSAFATCVWMLEEDPRYATMRLRTALGDSFADQLNLCKQ